MSSVVEFGLGLISLGRPWGHASRSVPSASEADNFLRSALAMGVRVFDTAPSYGDSESRLGRFLASLDPGMLSGLTIADKCGEHWDPDRGEPYLDHSYDALCRSIDRTLERLPRVDLFQVHRATAALLRSHGVRSALEYARSRGVHALGASVSDLEAARAAAESDLYTHLQFPFNLASRHLEEAFDLAQRCGKQVLVNRPFHMGSQLYGGDGELTGREALVESYRFILCRPFTGFILTGTCDAEHLGQDLDAFREAQQRVHPRA
jgi:aryl-alcohol dehydrogenase-like predicted oxidoreductase